MIMKTIYALMMVLFFASLPVGVVAPVFAQNQPSSSKYQPLSASDIVTRMKSDLNLTQDQVTAVTPIIEEYFSKRKELRKNIEDGTVSKDSIPSQLKQLRADENQELSKVLSADQMSQWGKVRKSGKT